MIYKIYKPSLLVQEYVEKYHLLHFNFRGSPYSPSKSYYPHAEQCLTFDPRGRITGINKQTGEKQIRSFSYLSQQQTSTYDLRFEEDYLMLKVVFKPGALFRLLGIPLHEFGEQYIDAENVIPSEVRLVNEQLANEQNYEQMIQIVERYLINKIKRVTIKRQPIDKVYDLMNLENNAFSLDWIASQACLSTRQLERKYLERIGVSPKVYNRILRFNKALKMKEHNSALSWFSIAIICGYADLQHLIKDFKKFSGVTPTNLINDEANSIQRQLKLV